MSDRKVSVLICTHLDENHEYLNLALKSVLNQNYPVDIYVVSSTDIKPNPKCLDNKNPSNIHIEHNKYLGNATKKAYWFMENCKTEDVIFLSDDCILSRECISSLMWWGNRGLIMNPMSNNENGSRFVADLSVPNGWGQTLKLQHDMSIKDTAGFEGAIMNYNPKTPILIPVQWVSFYATLLSKYVWNLVGGLDERLDVRHNDVDMCMRASVKGIQSFIALNAHCFHYGNKTLPKCTSEEDYKLADKVMEDKWRNATI